jgi:hypothetical protein
MSNPIESAVDQIVKALWQSRGVGDPGKVDYAYALGYICTMLPGMIRNYADDESQNRILQELVYRLGVIEGECRNETWTRV